MGQQDRSEDALFRTPNPLSRFKHSVFFRNATVSCDGSILAALDAEGLLHGWDTRNVKLLYRRQMSNPGEGPQRLTCSPDGRYLAVSRRDLPASLVHVLRLATGEEIRRFDRCFSPCFSPNGEILAGTDGPHLRRWAIKSGAELPGLEEDDRELKWAAYSPKGDLLAASLGSSSWVSVWDLRTRRRRLYGGVQGAITAATSLAFTPDAKTLAVGNPWGVRFFSVTDEVQRKLRGHEEYANGPLKFTADGRRLVAVCQRRRLLVWDPVKGDYLFAWSAFNIAEGILAVSEGGDHIIWFDREGLRVERIPQFLGGAEDGHVVKHVSFTSEGHAISGDEQGNFRVWNPVTQEEIRRFSVPAQPLRHFTRDGQWAVFGGGSDPVRIWDLLRGKEFFSVPAIRFVTAIAVSPDGASLALGHPDGSLSLWNIAENKERTRISLELAEVTAVCWSDDGRSLAWADERGSVVIADGAGRERVQFKPRGRGPHSLLKFSPDGKILLTCDRDGVYLAYEGLLGREPVRVEGEVVSRLRADPSDPRWMASGFNQSWCRSVAFSRDGSFAVSIQDGKALIWEAPGGRKPGP